MHMAAKKSAARAATKARREGTIEAAPETTTSPAPAAPKTSGRGKKASRSSPKTKKSESKRTRGRPRVSNTETERVTLRIESEHLQIIDTLVRLKQYSNRSDAIRGAIKAFCEDALEEVDDMIERQQKKQKLLQLEALTAQLAELQDQ